MRTRWKVIGGVAAAVVLAAQSIRPSFPPPGAKADLAVPDEVRHVLERACYDCHSSETKVPWFDEVAPAYWLVVGDVRAARAVLDFSTLGGLPKARQRAALFEAVAQISAGEMPPRRYTIVHPGNVVSAAELALIKDYLLHLEPLPAPPPAAPKAAPGDAIRPALNGIALDPSWVDWTAISFTDRFDNGTFRAILANDVAARAVADKQTARWPDGSTLAKVAWTAVTGGDVTRPAAFRQVETMTRDEHRFASTDGWGFARWLGDDLVPYGDSPDFAAECVRCHVVMASHDHVFTVPMEVPAGLVVKSAAGAEIDHRASTITALFPSRGGDPRRVSWDLVDDPHWFGGRIPGHVRSNEAAHGDSNVAPLFAHPRVIAK